MELNVRKISLLAVVIISIFAFSSPSLAEFVGIIGDELSDIIEHDQSFSLSDSKSTSVKVPGQSNTSSSSYSNSNEGSLKNNAAASSDNKVPQAIPKTPKKDLYSDLKRYTSYYNNGIDEVPELVKKLAGNDVIVLEIATSDNKDLKIKAVTKDGVITEFKEVSTFSGIDSTVSVSSDEDSIRALLSSDDPMGQLSASLNSDDIDIECKGFLKKAAVSGLKALA
jgi:hypothetical protein